MLYTITNSFHGTTARTKFPPGAREFIDRRIDNGVAWPREKAARRRAWQRLCGHPGCQCCNYWGER